jgi:hypothetical protein
MKKREWVVLGVKERTYEYTIVSCKSAIAATRIGRDKVNAGEWFSFRVARVTAEHQRGAVRL